jgi:hypothetical protein
VRIETGFRFGVNAFLASNRLTVRAICDMPSQTQSVTQSATQTFFSRSHDAVIRVFDKACNVIDTDEQAGQFALLRLMAPFIAIARLVIASVCTCVITAAGIHAVAAITFALLMTVLYVGTIARPIG